MPLLALSVLLGAAIAVLLVPPANTSGVVATVVAMAAGFRAFELLHLWLICRWTCAEETGVPEA